MALFNGSVKNIAGEFRTLQELIIAALTARTYSADADENAALKARAISNMRARTMVEVFIRTKAGEVYVMDAYKGGRGGITTQADWAAANFTVEPGGAELVTPDLGKHHMGSRVDLGNRIVYSVADEVIYLDVAEC